MYSTHRRKSLIFYLIYITFVTASRSIRCLILVTYPTIEMNQVEIIEFKNPRIQRLHFTKIIWFDSEESLIIFLEEKISKYGLVHSVIAKQVEVEDSYWYAYVDMYSEKAVNKAHQCLHENICINSKICKVRKVKGRCTDLPLAKNKCEKLANYYLGFNGWNSRLLYHQHESSEVGNECDKSTSNIITEKYATAIHITLPYVKNGKLSVEGVGIGLSDWNAKCPEGRGKARSFAAKQSRTAALQNAFSKLILIVLDDGKVTVEIDMNKNDPFVYNPIWDVPSIIVNEVYYEEKDQLNDSDFKNLDLLETLTP